VSRLSLGWVVAGTLAALFTAGVLIAAVLMVSTTDRARDDPAPRTAVSAPIVTSVAPPVRPEFVLGIGHSVGRPIAAGYLGLSMEFQAVRSYTGRDPRRIDPVLVQLIRNLSPDQPPVIRIGGDSTDASWVPAPGVHPPPQVTYKLTPSWFATTEALVRALGARLTMGLNLGANQPALAAAEAQRDVQVFGGGLTDFEIGNEPNVYDKIASYHTPAGKAVLTRHPGFGYPEYLREFKAIAARLPPRKLAGPALAAGPSPTPGSWFSTLEGFMRASPRLTTLTIHRYPLRNCYVGPSSPQYPSVPNLLSAYSTAGLAAGVHPYVALAHRSKRQLRVDELNSVACRGKRAVSDTFAAGLWVVDALFSLALEGVDGVNLHTLPNSAYELFRFSARGGRWHAWVAPVYYGLDLFARAVPPGSRLLRINGPRRGPGLAVWATRAPDGQVRAVIDNERRSRGWALGLRAPAGTSGAATLLRMQAPSVRARNGVTLGGVTFGAPTYTGVLPRPRAALLRANGGIYSLRVPAGSAVLVTFPASRNH
jgi:hypothetical protein